MLFVIISVVAILVALLGALMLVAKEEAGYGFIAGALIGFLALTGWLSFTSVSPGYAVTFRSFNTIVEEKWRGEGVHLRAPWLSVDTYEVRRQEVVMVDRETISGAAKGGVHVREFDVVIPYELRPQYLWQVRREVGNESRIRALIEASARSAARDALANFSWDELAFSKRDEASVWLSARFMTVLDADLRASGVDEEASAGVIQAYTAQIREVVVPEAILTANANLAASRVELERQGVLLEIAQQEAQRRATEGTGIQAMWENLPEAQADEIALILDAVSNKTRADALAQAVQDGRVTVMVLNGQETSVPVPSGR